MRSIFDDFGKPKNFCLWQQRWAELPALKLFYTKSGFTTPFLVCPQQGLRDNRLAFEIVTIARTARARIHQGIANPDLVLPSRQLLRNLPQAN